MILAWQLPLARGDDWITIIIFILLFAGSGIAQMIKKAKGAGEQES